jgi:D-Tyr-tRNAtyr deacylase
VKTKRAFSELEKKEKDSKVQQQNGVLLRVARFLLVQNTETGKIYQIYANYSKCA